MERTLICLRNTMWSPRDGDSLSKCLQFSLESKNFKNLFKDVQIKLRLWRGVYFQINMFSPSSWRIFNICPRVNTRSLNLFIAASKKWQKYKKWRLFTWNVPLRNAMRGQKLERELRKTKFHLNISLKFMINMKNGLNLIPVKKS